MNGNDETWLNTYATKLTLPCYGSICTQLRKMFNKYTNKPLILLYLGGRMAFRISSVCCLLASEEGLLGLGGGGTGPLSTICWGLTFKGRLWIKYETRYEKLMFSGFITTAGVFLFVWRKLHPRTVLTRGDFLSVFLLTNTGLSYFSKESVGRIILVMWKCQGNVQECFKFCVLVSRFGWLRVPAKVSFVVSRCYNNRSFPSRRSVHESEPN